MASGEQIINIVYDGEALKDHKMDILFFAESLQGLGNAIYEANTILNGKSEFYVDVDAGLIAGSFGFKLSIKRGTESTKDVLKIIGLNTANLIVGEKTVIDVLQRLKGRKVDIIEKNSTTGDVKLLVDGEEIECSSDVEKIVSSPSIRKAIDSFIHKPLLHPGVNSFEVSEGKTKKTTPDLKITKDEAESFKSPKTIFETEKSEEDIETTLTFVSANIQKKSGWNVIINDKPYQVKMDDDEFILKLTQPDAPSIFGELFVVKMKKITISDSVSKRSSYVVQKVGRQLGKK
ncbi:hypothetical protein C3Z14_12500 [Proteus mirabilis]|uniref:hypothetical protein n=1 Tax=Proteus mirabilis TaxID=584 RepID=UPI000CE07273|nr:hypothetical protein [Proteus mirabilis]AVA40785.1 hypothetical protein C3Z14_12500 [Proteus mirabilis]MCI9778403.1 hypothetical protein [Proteus mirabilis]MCL8609471.1 hypothetical protein [Proteus mirabilis]MCT0124805.1 hypothetical protein [Proteus mirabilis]MDF7339362.1 hypothetical protein [Proteus mirabilis]